MTKHIFTKNYRGPDRRQPLQLSDIDPVREDELQGIRESISRRESKQRAPLTIASIKDLIVSGIQSIMPPPDTFNQAEYERSKLPWTPRQRLITLLGGITLISGIIAIKHGADQIDTKRADELHELNEATKAVQFTDK